MAVTPNRNGYIFIAPQAEIGSGVATLVVPVGFEYDFQLPVRGLYVYPRLMAGYGAILWTNPTIHVGVIAPEAGIKYILHNRWSFALEPFSLPVFISTKARVEYRLFAAVGVLF